MKANNQAQYEDRLFDLLNLDDEGLEMVKKAILQNQLDDAFAVLKQYFIERTSPRMYLQKKKSHRFVAMFMYIVLMKCRKCCKQLMRSYRKPSYSAFSGIWSVPVFL